MSNYQPCPECGDEIDATTASIEDECPECGTPFRELIFR